MDDQTACSARGSIKAQGNWAGGLVGVNFTNSLIQSSYAAVRVEAVGHGAGGLSGTNEQGSRIINCYATGDVSGLRNVGGLVGFTSGGCEVNYCYSTGFVSAGLYAGGLVGRWDGVITTVSSYWNVETSGQHTSAAGTPLTTDKMLQGASFVDWDFVDEWKIEEEESYPWLGHQEEAADFNHPSPYLAPSGLTATGHNERISLSWDAPSRGIPTGYKLIRDGEIIATPGAAGTSFEDTGLENFILHNYYIIADYSTLQSNPSSKATGFAHAGFAGGEGTEGNPYRVSTAGELFTIRLFLDSYFLQIADIYLATTLWKANEGWPAIGTQTEYFKGQYDGDGFVISNLMVNRGINMYQGLFCVNDGAIMNLGIIDAFITGGKVLLELDVAQLSKGVYFLNIFSITNVFSRKVMVSNQ